MLEFVALVGKYPHNFYHWLPTSSHSYLFFPNQSFLLCSFVQGCILACLENVGSFLYFFQTKPYFLLGFSNSWPAHIYPVPIFSRPNLFLLFFFLRLHFSLPGRCCMCSPGWKPACTCPCCWGQKSHRVALSWRGRQACPNPPGSQPGINGRYSEIFKLGFVDDI